MPKLDIGTDIFLYWLIFCVTWHWSFISEATLWNQYGWVDDHPVRG